MEWAGGVSAARVAWAKNISSSDALGGPALWDGIWVGKRFAPIRNTPAGDLGKWGHLQQKDMKTDTGRDMRNEGSTYNSRR